MSVQVMSWIFNHCSPGAPAKKLIMLVLADFADVNGVCWPSNAKVATNASIGDVRYTRRLILELEEAGHIVRFPQFKDSEQKSNLTVIAMGRSRADIIKMVDDNYDFYIPKKTGEGLQTLRGEGSWTQGGGSIDPPGGGPIDPPEPSLITTIEPPFLPAGAGEQVSDRADTAPSLEKEVENDGRARALYESYLEIDWVSPEFMLNKVDFGDEVAFKALADAVNYRDCKMEFDNLQIAIQIYMDELEAATTPEQEDENEPVYELVNEDGSRYRGKMQKIKHETEFQAAFLRACKRKYFESVGQRENVARIEYAMLKQERDAPNNVGKPLGQWHRPYVMGRLDWATHENQLFVKIGPSKLIKAIVNPDNFAKWQEFQSDSRYIRKKKGGIHATQVVIGSKVTTDTGN